MTTFADNSQIYISNCDPGSIWNTLAPTIHSRTHTTWLLLLITMHDSHQPGLLPASGLLRTFPSFLLAKCHLFLEVLLNCHPPDKVFPDPSSPVSPCSELNNRWQWSTVLWQILNCCLLTCHVIANCQYIEGGDGVHYFCIPQCPALVRHRRQILNCYWKMRY